MIVHLDCSSGASGDKLVGALLDVAEQLGCYSERQLAADLAAFEPRLGLARARVTNGGISAWHIEMRDLRSGDAADAPQAQLGLQRRDKGDAPSGREAGHGQGHAHAHTHWAQIRARLESSDLPDDARKLAIDAFERIARAEAGVHGTSVEDVAFHEVGALDSIGDIVGCALLAAALRRGGPGEPRFVSTPLALGSGRVRAAHGILPVPAPATAAIICGLPVEAGPVAGELTTPTGAALVACLADSFGPVPPMVVRAIGMGAGARQLDGMPNVLRAMAGDPLGAVGSAPVDGDETAAAPARRGADEGTEQGAPGVPAGVAVEGLVLLDCNLDHISPEAAADACRRLMAAGALDVWQSPIAMKKGRLGINLNVLARPLDADALATLAMRLTGSLGMRRRLVERLAASRRHDIVDSSHGPVRFKSMVEPGSADGRMIWVRAEADDVARLAEEEDMSFSEMAEVLGNEGAATLGGATGPGESPNEAPADS